MIRPVDLLATLRDLEDLAVRKALDRSDIQRFEEAIATVETLLETVKRLADPDHACHAGFGGPWQDEAQAALFGRLLGNEEWWGEDGRYTVEEMMAMAGRPVSDAA